MTFEYLNQLRPRLFFSLSSAVFAIYLYKNYDTIPSFNDVKNKLHTYIQYKQTDGDSPAGGSQAGSSTQACGGSQAGSGSQSGSSTQAGSGTQACSSTQTDISNNLLDTAPESNP